MAAASPRCIQQLAPGGEVALHSHKSNAPSTTSCPAPSLHSQLHLEPCILPAASRLNTSNAPTATHTTASHHSSTASPSLESHSTPTIKSSCTQSAVNENPSWLSVLLSTKFYGPCSKHANLRKNDLNLFCTNHAVKICQYCHQASHHNKSQSTTSCTILHVSRYMYHDVLLAKEAASQLDVSEVQSYLNNGNRVVYIDRRAQQKSKLAPHAKSCAVCCRTLQDPYRFCSVFCRLAYANDPAAVATVPVPDASPLLQQAVRKAKKSQTYDLAPSSLSKRMERFVKRFDRHCSSNGGSPVSTPRLISKQTCPTTPPLELVGIKKNRRKGLPHQSPLSTPRSILLFHCLEPLSL